MDIPIDTLLRHNSVQKVDWNRSSDSTDRAITWINPLLPIECVIQNVESIFLYNIYLIRITSERELRFHLRMIEGIDIDIRDINYPQLLYELFSRMPNPIIYRSLIDLRNLIQIRVLCCDRIEEIPIVD